MSLRKALISIYYSLWCYLNELMFYFIKLFNSYFGIKILADEKEKLIKRKKF